MLFDVLVLERDRVYVVARGLRRKQIRKWTRLDLNVIVVPHSNDGNSLIYGDCELCL
jgi:hypothetical protein